MKLIILTILSIIALTLAAPSQITNNNVGDIINVGVHGQIDYNSQVDVTLINIILGFLNSQSGVVVAPADEVEQIKSAVIPDQPQVPSLTPEIIESFKSYLRDYQIPV